MKIKNVVIGASIVTIIILSIFAIGSLLGNKISDSNFSQKSTQSSEKNSELYQFLIKNSLCFYFVDRYSKYAESTKKTTIAYEGWHFRYVGKDIAKYITEKGIVEEYLNKLLNKEQ
ncbi:D-alanyl-D-alanine carboxypeptidase family protein [Floricoccus penangensis]|uniref:D-alanyl-D-alanine carboxypeptidase family protein n=1 Tax=Floricoccus penangensis TaxID=1859475 RepID=UPI00203CE613|nr:D-alanyl-D-alanine carboxypeptidase family protein [Floricoccus penangensis]URZ87953.1 D-alanyl-D-alanine carboxypeptidase family protein [Floricoccus penangensis]